VLLGFAVPVIRSRQAGGPDGFEHRWWPISAGVAVPVFAFFGAGVAIGGLSGLTTALTDRVAVGIVLGLVVGKTIGIMVATYLVAQLTRARLAEGLAWVDVWAWRSWPVSDSPSRYSSVSWPSALAARAMRTSRSPCAAGGCCSALA
jgi:Na+/H+ antiporter NhaA